MFTFYPSNLSRYDKWVYFEDCFSKDECDKILKQSLEFDANIPMYPNVDGVLELNDAYANSTIRNIPWSNTSDWIFQRLYEKITMANDEIWQFELNGIFEALDIIEYGVGGKMAWHADGLDINTSTRKLSMSIQLVDPSQYEDGDLELFLGRVEKVPRKVGAMALFPSYIYHQVAEVTTGTRITMVVHSHGRPYK